MGGVRARPGHIARAERRPRERERGEYQSEGGIRVAPRLSLQLCTGGRVRPAGYDGHVRVVYPYVWLQLLPYSCARVHNP